MKLLRKRCLTSFATPDKMPKAHRRTQRLGYRFSLLGILNAVGEAYLVKCCHDFWVFNSR